MKNMLNKKLFSLYDYAYFSEFSNWEQQELAKKDFLSLSQDDRDLAYSVMLSKYKDCQYNAGLDAIQSATFLYNSLN